MAKTNVLDQYDQFATIKVFVTNAGAADEFIAKLETGLTNRQTVGWKVSRLEFFLDPLLFVQMTAAGNQIRASLTQVADESQGGTADNAYIVDQVTLFQPKTPAANNAYEMQRSPFVIAYSDGHERLITPQNVYFHLYFSENAAPAACYNYLRIWYKEVELTAEDWYDLLQLRNPLVS